MPTNFCIGEGLIKFLILDLDYASSAIKLDLLVKSKMLLPFLPLAVIFARCLIRDWYRVQGSLKEVSCAADIPQSLIPSVLLCRFDREWGLQMLFCICSGSPMQWKVIMTHKGSLMLKGCLLLLKSSHWKLRRYLKTI